jgi:hypothetical protein
MSKKTLMIQEIKHFIVTCEYLAVQASKSTRNLDDILSELDAVTHCAEGVIEELYGVDSHFIKMLESAINIPRFNNMERIYNPQINYVLGVLRAVQHDMELHGVLQAEIFTEFLDKAEHLLAESHKDAAAVLLGAVLEASVRKIAESNAIPAVFGSVNQLTIDKLNVLNMNHHAYGPPVMKKIISWAKLGNNATHGHFSKYDAGKVKKMLLFVRKLCAEVLK